ncbi:hypothetical protein B0H10DRAFT_1941740 [Mycena sp. CBHHK59/15]|nr:hypothetical protein B0H10DRAFT_2325838 [Mycena sp. CBHHK59/15]KAJ6626744.1 hypothetical protein B0H10DRAFT_1941740 [Mycena sp. CBHHK59/15]
MPKGQETIASGKSAQKGFETAKANGETFKLESIVVDATDSEAAPAGAPASVKEGLPRVLTPSSSVQRGQRSHQTSVYPPTFKPTSEKPNPALLETLVLEKITYTHRALTLHFNSILLMVQYLTHTSVQFYPRDRWESSVMKVEEKLTWAKNYTDFSIPPNIYTLPTDYLTLVANWIAKILLKPKHTCACDAIRAANTIFYGIGVYTVMELFFTAGLSPFLTVYEIFGNPSWAARFLTAFYTYLDRGEKDLWSLLQPCIHDGVLAPSCDQCLCYADWLYVWATDHTNIPLRMDDLADRFNAKVTELGSIQSKWSRNSAESLYDVFEPSFLAAGLKIENNLGHLIFGEVQAPKSAKIRCAREIQGQQRDSMLFKSIVTSTIGVSIGPLEYCGTATLYMWAVYPSDPAIPKFHETRKRRGLDHISANLDKPGKHKRGRSDKENTRLQKKLSSINLGYGRLEAQHMTQMKRKHNWSW